MKMADLIDRNASIRFISNIERDDEDRLFTFEEIKKMLRDAPAVNRWIPCSERLPYIGVDVIVYVRTWREHKVQFGYRYSEETWSVANIGVPNDEIKFWMPLPEPPEKE
jgi:hypothetical protein